MPRLLVRNSFRRNIYVLEGCRERQSPRYRAKPGTRFAHQKLGLAQNYLGLFTS